MRYIKIFFTGIIIAVASLSLGWWFRGAIDNTSTTNAFQKAKVMVEAKRIEAKEVACGTLMDLVGKPVKNARSDVKAYESRSFQQYRQINRILNESYKNQ